MSKIAKLDQKITNLIAAGEVIERVSSVVKELVENSIDASSTIINIDLIDSGFSSIVVSDNGSGMDEEDIKACVLPHYTSKIKESKDLFSIHTLGFRGEALPSIASVSDLTIKSCAKAGEGYEARFVDGAMVGIEKIALSIGTTVEVDNLFYNTPARLQNMATQSSEISYVTEFVTKISLAYPEISFRLTNNAKTIFQTYGSNNILEVISNIYGASIAKEMIPFTKESNYFAIEGYTSKLSVLRSTKSHITILVNGRSIRNYQISNAIINAYSGKLMISKYPICVINISCDYSLVDVNVHPAKSEVRFSMEKELCELIKETITDCLDNADLTVLGEINNNPYTKPTINNSNPFDFFRDEVVAKMVNEEVVTENDLTLLEGVDEDGKLEESNDIISQTLEIGNETKFNFIYIGQLFDTYLLCQDKENFYLIDQHAAEERINYERIKDEIINKEIVKEELLVPFSFTFPPNESILIHEKMDLINSLGIELEEFGGNTFLVRAIGTWIQKRYVKEYLEEVFTSVIKGARFTKFEFMDSLAKSIACKASIKANEYHSDSEIDQLLILLQNCKNPYTCPHGRPVIIKYSKYDIEKWFKRVV